MDTDGDIPSLRAQAQKAQRAALTKAASQMVHSEGLGALSLRKLAKRVGASTSIVYTLFGSKDGLLRAMAEHALDELARRMQQVPGPVSLEYVTRLALAYRQAALDDPAYYRLLQMGVLEGDLESLARQGQAYQTLRAAVDGCFEASLLQGSSVDAVTDSLWSVVHGLVSLELAGYWSEPGLALQRFTECGWAVLRGFAPASSR